MNDYCNGCGEPQFDLVSGKCGNCDHIEVSSDTDDDLVCEEGFVDSPDDNPNDYDMG